MAGNPRKFSEKIAIHQRKLNEEQNAFESIIAEVSSITRSGDPVAPQWGPGTSAGNVYIAGGGQASEASGNRLSMGHTRGRSPGGGHGHYAHGYHPYRNVSPHGTAAPSSHSPERPQLTPPYPGAHMFLVPPQDANWRRTHSDPGIHTSVMQPTIPGIQPCVHARTSSPQNNVSSAKMQTGDKMQPGYFLEPKLNPAQYRPRSCDNVPNISIHPSEPVAGPQVPISTNTGSLPDLPSTLLPTQAHLQQLEGVLNSQVPLYAHIDLGVGVDGVGPSGLINLQQRHSIQLPVQYTQGYYINSGNGGPGHIAYGSTGAESMCSFAHSQTSPSYQPESPSSGPNTPNDRGAGSDESQHSPVTQTQSPDSPYYALHTKMQNVNIDSHDQMMSSRNAGYALPTQDNSVLPSSAYQEYSSAQHMANLQGQYEQQVYHALMMRQQDPRQYSSTLSPQGPSAEQQQSLRGGQIPDIIFTGADGSTTAATIASTLNSMGGYVDPTVELLSSDLRVSLDPVDLECLHGLNSEQGLNIDAASEDALRQDRA